MDVDGDASAVVAYRDRSVEVDGHVDGGAVAGEVFVDRVVEHFGDAVVEGAFIGAADVHARLFPDSLKAFEFSQF
jgi:hypothetical protein